MIDLFVTADSASMASRLRLVLSDHGFRHLWQVDFVRSNCELNLYRLPANGDQILSVFSLKINLLTFICSCSQDICNLQPEEVNLDANV